MFWDVVMEMVDKNKRILNAFSSTIENTKIDVWGPGIPGGFHGFYHNGSLMNSINNHMKTMRKGELQKLSVLSSYSNMLENEKDNVLKMKELEPIKKILSCIYNVTYNVKEDDGKLTDWAVNLVYVLSCNNIKNFSSTRTKKKRKASSKTKDGPKHGIAAPSVISKELADFFDKNPEEMMARTEAVSKLNEYILKNNLQNPENKREIILDDALVNLLKPPTDFGPVTYFSLGKLVGIHFPKSKKKQKLEEKKVEEMKVEKEKKVEEMKVEEEKKVEEMKVEEEKKVE